MKLRELPRVDSDPSVAHRGARATLRMTRGGLGPSPFRPPAFSLRLSRPLAFRAPSPFFALGALRLFAFVAVRAFRQFAPFGPRPSTLARRPSPPLLDLRNRSSIH